MAHSHKKSQLNEDLPKLLKGAVMTLSGNMSGKALLFILTLYIARSLGSGEVGIYFLGLTLIHVLAIIALSGLDVGIVRYVAIYSGRGDSQRVKGTILSAVSITFVLSWLLTGVAFAASDYCSVHLFHKPELGKILKLLSLSIPFETLMKVMLAVTRGLKLMQYVAIVQNIIWIGFRLVLTIVLVGLLDIGLVGVVWAYLISSVVASICALYFANKSVPLFDHKIKCIFNIRKLLNFSIPMVFTFLIHDVMIHVDVLMLGAFMPAANVGVYTVAVRLLSFAQVIFVAFQPIFQPFVAELHDKKEMKHLSILLKSITNWSVIISLPVSWRCWFSLIFFLGFSEMNLYQVQIA
jgi:O-antigen/teichoic acid export membrane protein